MSWKDLIHPKMGNPVKVAYGSTVGIVTCTGDKRIYIDGVYVHAGYGASTSAQIYIVPNGKTSDAEENRIIDESIASIQAECLLIANDKSEYNEPHTQEDKE